MMEQAGKGNVALLCMNVQKERTLLLFYNFFLACYKIAGIHFQADKDTGPLKPVVEDLKNFIENDPDAYMFFYLMFEQVPAINPNRQLGYRGQGLPAYAQNVQCYFYPCAQF